jgi:hypothetical protein
LNPCELNHEIAKVKTVDFFIGISPI